MDCKSGKQASKRPGKSGVVVAEEFSMITHKRRSHYVHLTTSSYNATTPRSSNRSMSAPAAAVPSRQAVLGLFRSMLRAAGHMEDYNFRSYAKRRVALGFKENRSVGGEALAAEYNEGLQQLQVLKRCVSCCAVCVFFGGGEGWSRSRRPVRGMCSRSPPTKQQSNPTQQQSAAPPGNPSSATCTRPRRA